MKVSKRGQGRFKNCLTLTDFYKDYLKENPKDSQYYITEREYIDICKQYLVNALEFIIQGGMFQMPHRLGKILVRKCKQNLNNVAIDWQLTKQEGCRVYNFNDHSNGYRYKIYWNKRNCVVKRKAYYSFFFTRQNNRYLAKQIKENKTDYYQYIK